jgi:hydroxymethylglutaryl-CoA reductase (NADPH)
MLLKLLYNRGSLHNLPEGKGVAFSIKNRLDTVRLTGLRQVKLGEVVVQASHIRLDLGGGDVRPGTSIGEGAQAIELPVGHSATFLLDTPALAEGMHQVQAQFSTDAFGELSVEVEDVIAGPDGRVRIPRSDDDDYAEAAIRARQQFAEQFTQQEYKHLPHYSFDPHALKGNCEHFVGVAQVPVGLAGPLHVQGEHAQGDFLIPMATTEGTLVASYNRGMQVLNLCGGVKCTVIGDAMQRAPVFVFDDARGARDFGRWVADNLEQIRPQAESTSRVAKLQYIDTYLSNKFAFLRFNFSTGDAAGQNMVGRATFAACSWILEQYKSEAAPVRNFYLESNFATDKKASQINVMRTRGKRVVAEAVVRRDVLMQRMRVTPEQLAYHGQVSNVGAFLSGANNNGAHSANGITALFIATGQDVANVSESSAGVLYSEVTKEGDLYISITIPSLIVATYGGGTGLATQNECLRMLGCVGQGTVYKFAEIVAGVVLAGELSLGAAISSSDWVSSHEQYGRNR